MVKNIPLGANKLKKDKDLNKKQIIQALFCIAMWVLGLQSLVKSSFSFFLLKK